MEYFLSPEEEKERQELFKPQQRVAQPYIQGPQLAQRYHETLDSLENDPQYIERAERFLRGLGEDDTMVDDLYEYFRDADYNIARGVNRAFKTLPNLSDQQKEDYAYLRDRFENADTGSLKQYLTATRDIGLDIASDPTAWIGALLVPWTGGGSMATRQAMAQTVKMGLKRVGKSFLHDKPMLGVVKKQKIVEMLPKGGIDWKRTMALGKQARTKAIQAYYKTNVKQMGKLGAAEGAFFTGMDDWLRQERDDIDGIKLREGLDYFSIGTSTAIGAGFGWLLGAGLTKAGQKISVNTQNNLRRFSDERQLNDSDFIYKAKQVKDTIISNTIGKPATRFLTLAEYSPTLTRLLENLRYDTFKGYEKRFLGESYGQRLTDLQGKYQVMYEDAVKPFMREGKAWWQTDGLVKEDQDILLQLMRTKPINWAESVPKATDVHKNSARAIRRLTYQVLLDSRAAGIYRSPLRRGPNDWMPRRYKWSVLDQDRDEFAQILVDEDAITLPDNIVADYLSIEDLSKYQVLENKIKNFTDVMGTKDEVAGEGWSSKELADLRNPGNLFKVYNDIQKEMTEILEKGTKNQAGLNVEKLRAANRIVDDMLDKKHLVHEIDAETTGTMGPSSFSPRSLWMINDESIAKFIDDDFNTLLMDYFGQSARLIARKEKLGVSPEEFKVRFIEPIRDELKEKGKVLTARDTKALLRTYKYAAGLDDQLTGGLGTLSDAIKLSQQVAHLPLATISSLTEIMIPLTRVNLSTYGKGMAQAIKHASKKVHHDSIEQLQTVHGLSTEEAYREMHRFYLGLEQAVAQRIDSLAGEGLQSPLMRKWQNVFFKTNLLSQWTRTVQLAAFTMGKDQIARNLRVLRRLETPSMKKKGLTKAETRSKDMAEQELLDLGINITEGKRWVARGEKLYSTVKDVRTNLLFWDSYYENEVMKGAARFANEVILDPSKSAVTRPNMQQSRAGTIFFQFLGYPTAFTNTVLKNYVNDVKRNPVVGTSKVLATSLGMTMVSAGFNALRSGGESLDKEPYEVVRDSVQRWGGLGYFEYIENLRRNVDIGGGLLGSSVKAIGGPAVGDVVDALLYRKGLGEIAATNIPGYSALSLMPSVKAKVKGFGKDIDYRSAVGLGLREPKEEVSPYTEHRRKYREQRKPYQEFRQDRYFEGGEIDLPVAQTKINPSSRIDRMTGLPYDEQAGDILKNRKGFAVGSIVTRGLTRGLSKYARQLFKGDDIVNDALFSKLKPVLKMIGSEEPAPSQPYTQSGHQRGVPQSELDLRKEGFLADSITDKVYYVMEDVGEEGADLVQSTQWGRPTIGIRASTRPEAIERGRELYRQGKQNLRMSRGHLRTRSPLNYEGDAPSETFSLLYDDDFLNLLRVEEQKLLGIKPKFDKRLSKETKKGLREEITIGGRGELISPTYTETWQRELGEVGPNIKRLESLKKDYEKTMGTIDKLDFTDSNFDADSIREGVLGFYTRSMHDILKDMGYDSIIYHGSPRARPKLIPIKTEPHTAKIERLITAQHRKEGGIDSDLYGELDYREVGGYRSVATEGEEPIDIAADVEDLMTATGTTEEELKKQGLTEFDPETIYDLEREAIDAEQRIYDSDVTTYRFEPEYKGVTKDIYPTEQTLSQEYRDNPTYIIFDSEQWMPFGTWEIPTTKEIADTNNLSIGNKIDFIKENTVLNTPTRVLERVLDNDRPLNIIRMGDNNEPIGIMHSFEEITPESLNSLRQRLDFRNPDQREAYKRLMDRYREYRGNEPGVRGIPGEGRVAASIDPIIPEESLYSYERQLDSELYSDDPLGRRMSTRKGSNLKPIDRDIESLQDYSDEELAALRRESERAEGALSVSFRNKRYDQNELDSIQQDIGELNVDRKGGFNNEFDEKVVPSIRDDEWFKSAQAMGRSEEELRRGEPVYMRIDTISGNDKQVLVTNERNEVPLITARGMINRIKGGKNSIYLHHPKDNNPLTDIARSWSILNRDHPDIVKTYDLTRIPKGTTETLGKRLERLEKERVRIVNFNRHQKQEIAEIITDKGKTKGPSKSEIEEADVIMWIPKTKGDEPKFLRHLIKDIPDGYVKSTIYRGWLEPEGFNHAAYPDVGDIHAQMIKVAPDRDVDTKDIIEGTGDLEAWEALAKQLEDNFVEEKMAVLKIGEPQSEIKRKELGYRPLSPPTEDQIQRKMAGRSEASAYSIVPRLTGMAPSGEESWTNANYAREFIDFLKSDAVVIRDITPTRLSSALEEWSRMAPSTLRRAEDILQGRPTRPQKGKAFNPVIDEATGKRILQGEDAITDTDLTEITAAELPRAIPVSIQNNKILFVNEEGADLYRRSAWSEKSIEGRDPQGFVLKTSGPERDVYLVPSEMQAETLGVPRRTSYQFDEEGRQIIGGREAAPIEEELASLGIQPAVKGLGKWEVGGIERQAQQWHDKFMGDEYVGSNRYQAFINDLKKTKTPEEIKDISLQIRSVHLKELEEKLPQLGRLTLDENGSTIRVQNEALLKDVEPTFKRLMVGNHGVYMEFAKPANKGTRIKRRTQYTEWDRDGAKLYAQFKTVNYANYRPGRWYASIYDYNIARKPSTLKRDVEGILKLREGRGQALPEQNIKVRGQPKVRTARQLLARRISKKFQADKELRSAFDDEGIPIPLVYKATKATRLSRQINEWDDIALILREEGYMTETEFTQGRIDKSPENIAREIIEENMVHPDDQYKVAEYESGMRDLFDTREGSATGGRVSKYNGSSIDMAEYDKQWRDVGEVRKRQEADEGWVDSRTPNRWGRVNSITGELQWFKGKDNKPPSIRTLSGIPGQESIVPKKREQRAAEQIGDTEFSEWAQESLIGSPELQHGGRFGLFAEVGEFAPGHGPQGGENVRIFDMPGEGETQKQVEVGGRYIDAASEEAKDALERGLTRPVSKYRELKFMDELPDKVTGARTYYGDIFVGQQTGENPSFRHIRWKPDKPLSGVEKILWHERFHRGVRLSLRKARKNLEQYGKVLDKDQSLWTKKDKELYSRYQETSIGNNRKELNRNISIIDGILEDEHPYIRIIEGEYYKDQDDRFNLAGRARSMAIWNMLEQENPGKALGSDALIDEGIEDRYKDWSADRLEELEQAQNIVEDMLHKDESKTRLQSIRKFFK